MLFDVGKLEPANKIQQLAVYVVLCTIHCNHYYHYIIAATYTTDRRIYHYLMK